MKYHWMKKTGLIVTVILAAALFGCSSDDDPTFPNNGGGGDTTAPTVTTITPTDGTLMVQTNQVLAIVFSEAMDPATATGNITMSHGAVGPLNWASATTLNVTPTGWPEATRVTVTLGTGLKDVAGNALGAAVEVTYGTYSANLFVFGTTPADGTININRAAGIELDFGAPMMAGTIEPGITISDGNKVDYPFTASSSDQSKWLLDPAENLPADTEITVTVGTSVMSAMETSFPEPFAFSFTTNDQVDDTPPTIVSFDPPSGSTMPGNQQVITMTFSEPINPDNFRPASMNGQFQWLISQASSQPSWNAEGDILTVPLPADLPAGLPLEVVFSDYSDLAGNVQTAETSWTSTVAGTAAPYPVSDGLRYVMFGEWTEGLPGSEIPTDSGTEWIFNQFTSRAGANQWNDEEWYDENYTLLDSYEMQTVTGAGVNIIGFAEEDDKSFSEYFLSGPVTLVEFPLVQGNTWSNDVTVTLPEGTLDVAAEGEVVGQMDLFAGEFDGIDITWTDVWKVNFLVDISAEGMTINEETVETWYAPGIGVVRDKSRDDYYEEGDEGWDTYDRWLYLGFGD